MFESSAQIAKALVLTVILVVFSTNTCAEIYKWRDARGVTKYSDIPPPFAFTKATRNELINAMQAKDVCILPNTKTAKTIGAVPAKLASTAAASNGAQLNFAFNDGSAALPSNKSAILFKSSLNSTQESTLRFFFGKFTGGGVPTSKPNRLVTLPTAPIAIKPAPIAAASTVLGIPPKQVLAQNTPPIAANTPITPSGSITPPNIVQVALMPAVDISKNIKPATSYSEKRILASNLIKDQPTAGDGTGQFRISCDVSHMSNDDPLVYPNQQGAAHHHTFFGNTTTNYKSDLSNLSIAGNSTCMGGIANRSAYWVPSMIDTSTDTALKPVQALWYYKTGYTVPHEYITAPPKGLRMITGNSKAISEQAGRFPEFTCFKENDPSSFSTKGLPNCSQGRQIVVHIAFPQCWDGVNLDSPDHKSHMAEADSNLTTLNKCPTTHPVAIPAITLNIKYDITNSEGTANWRLSSDNYAKSGYNAGYSAHADWVNGWDEKVMAGIVKNCLNSGKDCGTHMLGDGTVIY